MHDLCCGCFSEVAVISVVAGCVSSVQSHAVHFAITHFFVLRRWTREPWWRWWTQLRFLSQMLQDIWSLCPSDVARKLVSISIRCCRVAILMHMRFCIGSWVLYPCNGIGQMLLDSYLLHSSDVAGQLNSISIRCCKESVSISIRCFRVNSRDFALAARFYIYEMLF